MARTNAPKESTSHSTEVDKKVNLLWKPDKDHDWKRLPVTVHQVTGQDITIYLNRHYLTKALRFGLDRLDSIDPMSPVRFSNEGRQMIVILPVRAESTPTAAPQAQETPSQQSTTTNEERTPMINETTATSTPAEPPSLDAQFDLIISDVDALRTTAQDHLTEINGVRTKLKALQREHKASAKELQSVRQTLKGLQGLKI